jgi:hypothetical protein
MGCKGDYAAIVKLNMPRAMHEVSHKPNMLNITCCNTAFNWIYILTFSNICGIYNLSFLFIAT